MLPDHFPSRRTGHVHRHIAAANHNYLLADGELIAEIHVEQEIDPLVDAIQVNAGDGEVAAAVRAHGDQHRVEALMVRESEVSSCGLIQLEGDVAGLENLADLRLDYVARQAIFGNAQV